MVTMSRLLYKKKSNVDTLSCQLKKAKSLQKIYFLHINSKTPYKLLVEVERQD